MEIVPPIQKNIKKSPTWVKERGGGHPTWLLLVVQQLVAGLEVLVTVLTAVLPLLCRERGKGKICIPCGEVFVLL